MIDKKPEIDVRSIDDIFKARRFLGEILNNPHHSFSFTKHALERMSERNLNTGDIINVLNGGRFYDEPDYDNGQYKFKISTFKITVLFIFISQEKIHIVTAWRNT